jgi:hypothetical protein
MKVLGKNYFDSEQIAPLLKQLVTELTSQPESVAAAGG